MSQGQTRAEMEQLQEEKAETELWGRRAIGALAVVGAVDVGAWVLKMVEEVGRQVVGG